MHKFYLGQPVDYYPSSRAYLPRGAFVVTAKLPEKDGEFEYHIKHLTEPYERVAKESELRAIAANDDAPHGMRQ